MQAGDPELQVNSAGLQVGGRPQVLSSTFKTRPDPVGQEQRA